MSAPCPRSDEPILTHLRLGERPSQQGADQFRQDWRHAVSRQRHRARAALPSVRNFGYQDATCAAISLMGQCSVFVRNREQFAQPLPQHAEEFRLEI
jgi:hypothetical protein